MCVRFISICLLIFCGMTAFLSLKVLDPNVNVSPVFTFDEKYMTMDITAATKGDHYFISALETIHQLSQFFGLFSNLTTY